MFTARSFVFCLFLRMALSVCTGDPTKCALEADSKKKPVENFRFTKSFDVGFVEQFDALHPDLREAIRSEMRRITTENRNSETKPAAETNAPAIGIQKEQFDNYFDNVTSAFKAIGDVMYGLKNQLSYIKGSIEALSANTTTSTDSSTDRPVSKKVRDGEPVINSLVGVDRKPQCQCTYEGDNSENDINGSLPKSCKEILENGNKVSGIYEIKPRTSSKSFMVLCDMETKEGGWTHIQRRLDGSQDFYLGWKEYKFGFGDLNREFWMGLENIYSLTGFESSELLVELVSINNVTAFAHYKTFQLGPGVDSYPLKTLTGYSGDAGDSLVYHLGQKFSTKDLDLDEYGTNCALEYSGAWWYKSCYESNLNGKFMNMDLSSNYINQCVKWNAFSSDKYCLAKSRMLVRPA